MAQIIELGSKAALFLLALVLLLRSAAGSGSPRWEDRDGTWFSRLVRLRPFLVQVDEVSVFYGSSCDACSKYTRCFDLTPAR